MLRVNLDIFNIRVRSVSRLPGSPAHSDVSLLTMRTPVGAGEPIAHLASRIHWEQMQRNFYSPISGRRYSPASLPGQYVRGDHQSHWGELLLTRSYLHQKYFIILKTKLLTFHSTMCLLVFARKFYSQYTPCPFWTSHFFLFDTHAAFKKFKLGKSVEFISKPKL